MKHFLHILIATALLTGLVGCKGSKHFAKQGFQLEEQGMYEEAAVAYYNSVLRNRSNVVAQIGLKKMGQQVLIKRLQTFTQARMTLTSREAVYAYLEAEKYVAQIQNVGVVLDIPEFYKADFNNSKETFLGELYEEGTTLLEEEKFQGAEGVFAEILRLEPSYSDVGDLNKFARVEPMYRSATDAYNNGKYRTAYNEFDEVDGLHKGYKDCTEKRDDALVLGQFTLAMLSLKNGANDASATVAANAYILQGLTSINDPFLKVVDRDNLDEVIEEQHLQLSGVMDQNTAVEVGNLIGAKAIVTGTLLGKSTKKGNLTSQGKTGFTQHKIKKYNKEEDKHYYETQYKKAHYREYYSLNEAYVSIQFKVISLQTGEVLASEIVQKKVEDSVHYAVYDGESAKLFPANGDKVNTSKAARSQLRNLLNASRSIKSVEELTQESYKHASNQIACEVSGLLKTTVQ